MKCSIFDFRCVAVISARAVISEDISMQNKKHETPFEQIHKMIPLKKEFFLSITIDI